MGQTGYNYLHTSEGLEGLHEDIPEQQFKEYYDESSPYYVYEENDDNKLSHMQQAYLNLFQKQVSVDSQEFALFYLLMTSTLILIVDICFMRFFMIEYFVQLLIIKQV